MSIFTSLWIGTSGLEAHGDALSVVGDNIANASTFGHRASRAGFAEVLGGTAPQGQRLGAGVRFEGTQTLFGQGALVQTGVDLDMAVRGDGFFVVKGNHGGVDASYYTRDGRFRLDQDGYSVPGGINDELRLLRERHRIQLLEGQLDCIHAEDMGGKNLVTIDDRVIFDAAHPRFVRALEDPDPIWVSFLASVAYTALNHWLEEVTDAHEILFHAGHAELLLTGLLDAPTNSP